MKEIDLNTWYRKEFYLYYKSFHSPLYGKTLQVDVTKSYNFCKDNNYSFFLFCLYVFLKSSNEVKEFRHREIDNKIYDMQYINASTPILKKNDTNNQFTNIELPLEKNLQLFLQNSAVIMNNAQNGVPPGIVENEEKGIMCFSFQPWFSYTGGFGAKLDTHQTMPLLDWGKFSDVNGQKIMPYSLQVNHMFIDGYHFGEFINKVESYFQNPQLL